jgi:hypothetical protein
LPTDFVVNAEILNSNQIFLTDLYHLRILDIKKGEIVRSVPFESGSRAFPIILFLERIVLAGWYELFVLDRSSLRLLCRLKRRVNRVATENCGRLPPAVSERHLICMCDYDKRHSLCAGDIKAGQMVDMTELPLLPTSERDYVDSHGHSPLLVRH